MTKSKQVELMRKVTDSIGKTHAMDEIVRDLTLLYRDFADYASYAEHLAITEMLPAMIDMVKSALYEIDNRIRNTQTTETKGE